MPFATWWRGDPFPKLSPLLPFSACLSTDKHVIAQLAHLSDQEINTRIQSGNYPYIAFMDETPVAYGWTATHEGRIAELQFSFPIQTKNCYLWDFMTLPEWRGRGIYPRLLQAIIQQEQSVDRFWIGYEPGNEASMRGITKAGFHVESDLVISEGRVSGLALFNASAYAQASAHFFHLPIVPGE
ncbi:GNAT family N-acetyltransferase [Dictyobacter arantiisoli]|uniref:N-acetyltransferase domain-containing protein n=1 Tax=Dictyobacter arantiisoli TaxID=2014874 RepID=A0A5A5T755_9CHLR|nr:GNAT family N-acetyltransferase [Dictyobacter arantiisoli]GCF07311.1 hypothetical protein KDI_08750 [Dictyobacter arantiisoli]